MTPRYAWITPTRFSQLSASWMDVCTAQRCYPLIQLACVGARNWLRRRRMDQRSHLAYINAPTRVIALFFLFSPLLFPCYKYFIKIFIPVEKKNLVLFIILGLRNKAQMTYMQKGGTKLHSCVLSDILVGERERANLVGPRTSCKCACAASLRASFYPKSFPHFTHFHTRCEMI